MPIKRRNRVSACHAVIAACTSCAIVTTAHNADSSDPPRNTGLPCGYEVAAIIKGPVHPFFGQASLIATGMNELGWATGFYFWLDTDHAFYWTPETGLHTIPLPDGFNRAIANDVNEHGVVVGDMEGPAQHWRGFVYDTNTGAMTILEPVQNIGSAQCWANAINNDGVVVGARSLGETKNPYNAFIWTPDKDDPTHGTFTDLGVMNGPNSTAQYVSDHGVTVGWSGHSVTNGTAYQYADGRLTLIGPIAGGDTSSARAVTSDGVIVGSGRSLDNGTLVWQRGYSWKNGRFTIYDPLQGYQMSGGADINDDHVVVGMSATWPSPVQFIATLWYGENSYDLNEMLSSNSDVYLREAMRISNAGTILAKGTFEGKQVGVLLTPAKPVEADLTGDCLVGPDDLVVLLSEWGKQESPADLNDDGIVNGADLAILLGNWTP